MMKILVIGKHGQVGWELQRTLATMGFVEAVDVDTLDLSNSEAIRKFIRQSYPQIIVNAAAYTAVDKAETEFELAMAINGHAPGILAEEAKRLGAILVHYSTDYVFDGTASEPYLENSKPNPLNKYGYSKLAGDQAIEAVGGQYLILRTSWVYGSRGKNFLLTMLKLAKEKENLNIVEDQVGAPTWSRMIAQGTAHLLTQCIHTKDRWGTYNFTASGQTTWKEFAETIFKIAKQRQASSKTPIVTGIQSSGYPTPATRPLYSVLSHDKLNNTFGLKMPSWDKALELCMDEFQW